MKNLDFESEKKWDHLASSWAESGPPAAPSRDDVANYMGAVPQPKNVLLLGSTPALRRRISPVSRLVSIDVSPAMIATTAQMVRPSVDSVVRADWRSLPVQSGRFDLVLGDKILGNVSPKDWPTLFTEIRRACRTESRFATRASPHGIERLEVANKGDFGDLVEEWSTRLASGMVLSSACSGLWEDCMDASTVNYSDQLGTQQLGRFIPADEGDLLAYGDASQYHHQLLSHFHQRYWTMRDLKWSAYCVDGIVQAAQESFHLVDQLTAADYPEADRQPVFVFAPK